ncbi:Outer membrane protein beta-barrel domain-containing protein [Cnuella takakiae]|uniref:Outer membrane protein beta-barrel domain-containing protein n=1 Tax=Cnuella takakiae TaxID=1302690 RepID=A0A1M4VKL8_9BACT|nr:porin family protein [Cnuella takakiae]OLY94810.1 hypothetical protein BUE76_12205 [Cnuella takakiae]SHE69606.1 Outer membrane protein beta-barrel domain-containing protein [Cnuella takakiae]
MKIKLSVIALFVLLSNAAMAQLTAGVKAGANITKVDGKSFKQEFRYGYQLGGFAMIGLGDKFALQPEVLYTQTQTRVDSNFRNIYQSAFQEVKDGDVKLNYLTIPIMLNYKFIGNLVSLQAGPQFGVLLNKDKNLLENGKSAFSGGDFSMAGGLQVKVSKAVVSGRYVVGLKNINDLGDQNKWRNQAIQISVGLAL